MSFANLNFSLILIHKRHTLYICKHNLQAAMDKEDCGSIAVSIIFRICRMQQLISNRTITKFGDYLSLCFILKPTINACNIMRYNNADRIFSFDFSQAFFHFVNVVIVSISKFKWLTCGRLLSVSAPLGFFQLLAVNGQSPQAHTHRISNGIGHRRRQCGNAQLADTADFVPAPGDMHLDFGHLGHG